MKFPADLVVPDVASLNVNKRTNYTSNTNTAVELLDVISAVIDNKVTEQIRESPVVIILCDESTDIMVHHKLVINCRIVDPHTLAPKPLFLTDRSSNHGRDRQGDFQSNQR